MTSTARQQVAVISGASSGIGAATAQALYSVGYRLFLGARRLDRLSALAQSLGADAIAQDVRDADSVVRFAAAVEQRVGAIDVLVNSAGLALGQLSISEAVDEEWSQVWETNVLGMVRLTRACLPLQLSNPQAMNARLTTMGRMP